MADHWLGQVQACLIRVGLLGPTGVPLIGAANAYVSDALVKMGVEPEYEDGEAIQVKNACGNPCIDYQAPDNLRRGTVTIELCTPDPILAAWLSGGERLAVAADPVGPPITEAREGYAAPPVGPITGDGISIEVWAKRIAENGGLDGDFPYAWWAYPMIRNLRIGGHAHENAALGQTFTGQLLENANWGDGPGIPGFPATTDRIWQWIEAVEDEVPLVTHLPIAIAA